MRQSLVAVAATLATVEVGLFWRILVLAASSQR